MGFWGLLTGQSLPSPSTPTSAPNGSGGVSIPGWQSEGVLSSVVLSELLGSQTDMWPVTRAEAMRVPSVVKARHTLVAAIARNPLVALEGTTVLPDDRQPTGLYRTSGATSPWHRMAWTVDDVFFNGWALWETRRGSRREPLTFDRVPPEWWRVTEGVIETFDRYHGSWTVREADELVLIPGPSEGFLDYASDTLRAARNVERSWQGRVRSPIPLVELHMTDPDEQLTPAEQRQLVASYVASRQDTNGAVIVTPAGVQLIAHGEARTDTLVEARNAIRLDVANFTGLPAEALDGSLSTASLTYTTQEGTRTELSESVGGLWMEPIQARLSQDDVVPRGQRVRFDLSDTINPLPTSTGPTEQD